MNCFEKSLIISFLMVICGCSPDISQEDEPVPLTEGDFLGGSISDDMLPIGELRSQSPTYQVRAEATRQAEPDASVAMPTQTREEAQNIEPSSENLIGSDD